MPKSDWPTLAEAAKTEGITTEAMRKRITRGQVDAQKVGNRWRVNPNSLTRQDRTETDKAPGQDRTTTGDGGATLREVVEAQRAHIESLERELAHRNAEVRELHEDIAAMNKQLTVALPAPNDDASMGQHQSGQSPTRWWHRLTRK